MSWPGRLFHGYICRIWSPARTHDCCCHGATNPNRGFPSHRRQKLPIVYCSFRRTCIFASPLSLAPINRIIVSLVLIVFGIDACRSFTFYCFHSDSSWRFSFSPASTVLMPEKSMTRFVQFLFSPFLLSRPLVILLAPTPLIVGGISLAARWGGVSIFQHLVSVFSDSLWLCGYFSLGLHN